MSRQLTRAVIAALYSDLGFWRCLVLLLKEVIR